MSFRDYGRLGGAAVPRRSSPAGQLTAKPKCLLFAASARTAFAAFAAARCARPRAASADQSDRCDYYEQNVLH